MPQTDISNPPVVHVQDFQAFQCTLCGKCCSRNWSLKVENPKIPLISETAIFKKAVKEGYVPIETRDDGRAEFARRADHECVFLETIDIGQICGLRAEVGNTATPLSCQMYPYHTVDTPDGVFVHTAFTCPPIVLGQDLDVKDTREGLTEILSHADRKPTPNEETFTVALTEDRTISWKNYLQLEKKILELHDPRDPRDSILKTCLAVLTQVVNAPEEGDIDWSTLAWGREDLNFAREMFDKFVSFLASTVEEEPDPDLREAYALAIEEGRPAYSITFDLHLPARVPVADLEPWILEIFDRYLRNAILGKALLRPSVVAKLLANAMATELVSLFAGGIRNKRQEESMTLETITEAFDIVECDFITHRDGSIPMFLGLESTLLEVVQLPPLEDEQSEGTP